MKLKIAFIVISVLYFISVSYGLISGLIETHAAIVQSGLCLLFAGLAIWRNAIMIKRRK